MKDQLKKLTFVLLAASAITGFTTSHAADATPTFNCTLTDQVTKDGAPGDAKDTFTVSTPMIYLLCTSSNVVKGQVLKADWIAIDTNKVAPPNYQIAEKSVPVDQNPTGDETWNADLSLSKPTKGWPTGSYRVDLFVNDKMNNSITFTIK